MKKDKNPICPILMVDDEPQTLTSYTAALGLEGYNNLVSCSDSRKAVELIEKHPPEVILLDLSMPHLSGEEFLPLIIEDYPEIPVVVITGTSALETAVRCIRNGAFDYLVKPVTQERLITTVRQAITFRDMSRENTQLKDRLLEQELEFPKAFSSMVTANQTMFALFRYVEAIARTSRAVTITGETGVGKELLALALHKLSGLKGKFVTVNAAGLDENVFNDTLFGHAKGAFTGADHVRKGMVEQAEGGTLFLDEIGDLGAASQVKLLRLLQEREYLPLGMDIPKKATARIVAATNQDLEQMKETDAFRKDLYYRLITHRVHIPPLRERLDDLPLLVDYFIEQASEKLGKKKRRSPKNLLQLLFRYPFPGNLRELEALVFNAVMSSGSETISLQTFKSSLVKELSLSQTPSKLLESGADLPVTFGKKLPTMNETKGLLIEEALRRSRGNKSLAAEMLGTTRQIFYWRDKGDS